MCDVYLIGRSTYSAETGGETRSRELALGIEGLQRFVRCEPLRRVHECAFDGVALEIDRGRPAPVTQEGAAIRPGNGHPLR